MLTAIIKKLKNIFTSKYKKLLYDITVASANEEQLQLPNGVVLNFQPGYEYDNCSMYVLSHESKEQDFTQKYISSIGKTISLTVYDCFSGDVKVLAVGSDRIFVEIVDANSCYSCQMIPIPGAKYWVGEWEISEYQPPKSVFEEAELPF